MEGGRGWWLAMAICWKYGELLVCEIIKIPVAPQKKEIISHTSLFSRTSGPVRSE